MTTDLDFLSSSAEGLDLTNSEDRAIFRTRVAYRLRAPLPTPTSPRPQHNPHLGQRHDQDPHQPDDQE